MKSRLLLYLLLLPALLTAQPYAVRQLGIEKGLSNNYVVSIAQDKEGFLWFATEEGLNKFDGTRFITYYKNETSAEKQAELEEQKRKLLAKLDQGGD